MLYQQRIESTGTYIRTTIIIHTVFHLPILHHVGVSNAHTNILRNAGEYLVPGTSYRYTTSSTGTGTFISSHHDMIVYSIHWCECINKYIQVWNVFIYDYGHNSTFSTIWLLWRRRRFDTWHILFEQASHYFPSTHAILPYTINGRDNDSVKIYTVHD